MKTSNQNKTKGVEEKYCHGCGELINILADPCPSCGAPQHDKKNQLSTSTETQMLTSKAIPLEGQVFCHGCGEKMHKSAINCPNCGAVNSADIAIGGKQRVTAGLFAILLGGIGVHHFYLGNVGLGILYVLFCWTFIPMIVGFIEGIVYLSQTDQSFSKKYN
jgi:RNA polymerase subunit RPABC4/transcription elongation factor Spt4